MIHNIENQELKENIIFPIQYSISDAKLRAMWPKWSIVSISQIFQTWFIHSFICDSLIFYRNKTNHSLQSMYKIIINDTQNKYLPKSSNHTIMLQFISNTISQFILHITYPKNPLLTGESNIKFKSSSRYCLCNTKLRYHTRKRA